MELKTLPGPTRWTYLTIGIMALLYGLMDKFFLPEIDNLGVAFPIGLMFIIMSQSDRIAAKLGKKGLIVALLLGMVMFLAGLGVFFLVR